MNTPNPSPEKPSDWLPSRSSVLTRVPPELRKAINSAIINYAHGSYRKLYDYFELEAHNVSFTAFYYYARRIRTAANLAELRRLKSNSDSRTHQVLPDILAENLLDAALEVENSSSHKIARLARAYRITQAALAARETHQAALKRARVKADREETQSLLDHARRLSEINREIVKRDLEEIAATDDGLESPVKGRQDRSGSST